VNKAIRSYIGEESRDTQEQPVYLPGDSIHLRLRVTHEANLGSVWALFRRRPKRGEALSATYITLPGEHYSLSRAGAVRTSEVYLEMEVCRTEHLPGDYVLEALRAYPYALDGREELMMEIEVRDKIGFRIAEEVGAPSPRVTGWKFD
jgi:hypothetical protein